MYIANILKMASRRAKRSEIWVLGGGGEYMCNFWNFGQWPSFMPKYGNLESWPRISEITRHRAKISSIRPHRDYIFATSGTFGKI